MWICGRRSEAGVMRLANQDDLRIIEVGVDRVCFITVMIGIIIIALLTSYLGAEIWLTKKHQLAECIPTCVVRDK